ncbi:MAG: glycosyltransferase family 39 protein, partial [Nitrospirae bacterium]|nr:glycosyltransferase family 39 protein [Nitrospirota bacterium]
MPTKLGDRMQLGITLFDSLLYAALSIYTVFILFYNLSDRYFWADEAETADLAVSITKFGVPKAYDGKNYISLYGPSIFENKSNIVTWRPWLDEYLAALSFKTFGFTTTAGRIPFTTTGAAAVFLMALLSYRIFKSHKAAISAAALVAASELFVLHARQCRYYSIVIFAEIALILALYNILTGKRKSGVAILTASLALQFYTNYIVMGGSVFAIGILAVFTRKRNKGFLSSVLISMSAFSLIALPWLIYAKPWSQSGFMGRGDIVSKLQFYISEIHFNIFPFVLIFIPPAYYLFRWIVPNTRGGVLQKVPALQKDIMAFLVLTIPFNLAIVSLAPEIYIRYIVHLIPVFVLLIVFILANYVRPVWLKLPLICLLCFTNYISYVSAYPFKSLNEPMLVMHYPKVTVYNLIKNTLADSSNQLEDTVSYLQKEGKPTDTVLSSCPEFALMFYTGMRVINARFIETVDFRTLPEWIFPECITEDTPVEPLYPPLEYAKYYRTVTFTIHDGPVIGNMPVPDIYGKFTSFGTSQVTLYRLMPGAPADVITDVINEKGIFKPRGFNGNVTSVNVSTDGRFIAVSGSHNKLIDGSGQVKITDVKTGAVVKEITSNIHPIKSAFLTPDGKSVIGIVGNTVKRWDAVTGRKLKTFAGHKDQINAIALVADSNQLLSAAKNNRLKLWD